MTKEDEIKVVVNSIKMFKAIKDYTQNEEAWVTKTKYKIVEKKLQPVATPLPKDNEKVMKDMSTQ